MKLQKIFSCATALTASLALLAGCSSAPEKANDGKIHLTYWLWDAAQLPPYRACAQAFGAENPNIQVDVIQYGWDDYWTQLTATMVGEAAPDIFTNHTSRFAKFAQLGQVLDIQKLIERDAVNLSDYQDGLADLWKGEDGKTRYALPKDWDTEALFYNEKKVAEAGYKAEDLAKLTWNPEDGGTFEKFLAHITVDKAGKRGDEPGFNKDQVATYGIGYNESGGEYGQVQWAMYALSTGWTWGDKNPWPSKWNYDDPRFVKTIKWWRSLIEKGYAPSLAAATSGTGTMGSLSSGAYATLFEGSWNISNIVALEGGPFKTAPTPIGPKGRASVLNGLGDSIWSGTKHPDEAWKFVKFLGSSKCQAIVADAGIVFPARKDALEKAEAAFSKLGVDPTTFSLHVKEKTGVLSPVANHWSALSTIMKPTMDTIIMGNDDPIPLLTEANKRANELMKRRR